jgi:hypothetical protein
VVAAPALVGWKLKLFVFLEESTLFGNLIKSNFLKLNHFPQVFFSPPLKLAEPIDECPW